MSDVDWLGASLTAARPQAMAALLRYFRDLDLAEEAFQEACLRALKHWPVKGPPRDPAAWLIFVGRNAGLDGVRRRAKDRPLPPEERISDLEDFETDAAERIDAGDYRDDVLRLLFICCHPDLPAVQQIALALRVVSGLTVQQIARAFLVSAAAMEQRITRAKRRVATAGVAYETPGPAERAERLTAVAAMVYLIFNEGYSAPAARGGEGAPLCDEAIRLGRLLLRLYPAEAEVMGLTALMLLQHSRTEARRGEQGAVVLLEDQDRRLWNRAMIAEGVALMHKAARRGPPGPYQAQAAIAVVHARAAKPEDTDWTRIEAIYAELERLQPSPVVTLNRAVALAKAQGPAAALALIEPLERDLASYFYFHGARGALLAQLDRGREAREAFDRAISLAHDPAEAAYIRGQLDRLAADAGRPRAQRRISWPRLSVRPELDRS